MFSSKHAFFLLALVLAVPAHAQERSDEPSDDLAPRGGRTGHRTEEPTDDDRKAPPPPAPRAPDRQPEAAKDGAPWSWPWGGAVRSPSWTQDENWVGTHFWLMDVGHVQLEGVWNGTVARRSYEVDQLFQAKARIGLLPHIELSITENATLFTHDHLRQEGNEIGGRFAFWDYGTLPLNPAIEIVWHPRHDAPDAYAARGMIGGELWKGFFFAGNAFFEGETGGSHDYNWGFRGGATYELLEDVLRVGVEGGVRWHWNRDHDKTPFRDTAPSVGPTLLFRPLALIRKEWGQYAKLTLSGEFGVRDDNKNVPFLQGGAVFAFAF